MKLIKMLGLGAIAAMAAIGVPSAMAESTALCTVHEDPCPPGNAYTGHIEGLAENLELLTTFTNLKCKHSTILGNVLSLASPQVIHLELVDFTGDCLFGSGTSCSIEVLALGLLLLLETSLNLGELQSHGTEVHIHCGSLFNCTYGGLLIAHEEGSTGGGLGTITASKTTLEKTGGSFCPSEAKWDAIYKIQVPDPIYVTT